MEKKLTLKLFDSNYALSDSNFNSLSLIDNYIYYTLCTHDINGPGRVYRLDTETEIPELIGDLADICGEGESKRIPQGKSHTPFYKYDGKIWFATHCSFYGGSVDGKENPAPPPEGYLPYSGGRIVTIDKDKNTTVVAKAPDGEGIITMSMDTDRGIAYCLTWPSGLLLIYDAAANTFKNCGKVALDGEIGVGERYSCLCRTIAIEPTTGTAYFTLSNGEIYETDKDGNVKLVPWCNLKRDIFGQFDPTVGGHQGYNWRYLSYSKKYRKFFGVHGKSGWLFTFDPVNQTFEILDRIASRYCKQTGAYEEFRYGYMTLTASPVDEDLLHYISGYSDPETKLPVLTAISYHIATGTYVEHGRLCLPNGACLANIQTLAVTASGDWYVCPWCRTDETNHKGEPKAHVDLAKFRIQQSL